MIHTCRKGTIKVRIQNIEDNLNCVGDQGSMTTWVLRTTNIRRFRLLNSASLRHRRGTITKLIVDGVTFNLVGEHRDISEELLFSGTFLRDLQASKSGPRWQVYMCLRYSTFNTACCLLWVSDTTRETTQRMAYLVQNSLQLQTSG